MSEICKRLGSDHVDVSPMVAKYVIQEARMQLSERAMGAFEILCCQVSVALRSWQVLIPSSLVASILLEYGGLLLELGVDAVYED